MPGIFKSFLSSFVDFFFKKKRFFQEHSQSTKRFEYRFVGPDLASKYLQRFLADGKIRR